MGLADDTNVFLHMLIYLDISNFSLVSIANSPALCGNRRLFVMDSMLHVKGFVV